MRWQNGELNKQRSDNDIRIAAMQKQIDDLKKEETTTTKPATNTTTDKTAGWKTFTSTEYGFSIKYPDSLQENTFTNPTTHITEPDFDFGPLNNTSLAGMIRVVVNDSQWATNKDFAHWATGQITSEKETTINGQPGYRTVANSDGGTSDTVFIIHSGKAYEIGFVRVSGPGTSGQVIDNSQYQDTFEKMISTFKFTN